MLTPASGASSGVFYLGDEIPSQYHLGFICGCLFDSVLLGRTSTRMNQFGVMKKGTSTDMTVSRGPVSDSVSLRYLQRLPAEQAADGAMQDREGEWLVWASNFAIFGTWPRRHADMLAGRSYFCVATPSAVQTSWRSEVVRCAACQWSVAMRWHRTPLRLDHEEFYGRRLVHRSG